MRAPLVSIIVPVYNVVQYADKCIVSLVRQTYRNIEIILIDDGSTDGSGLVLDAWIRKDSRIKVFHTVNGGVTAARKEGWRQSTGEYCIFVDADDSLTPDAVAYFIAVFAEGDYDFVSGAYDIVYNDGRVVHKPVPFTGMFGMAEYIAGMLRVCRCLPSIGIGMFRSVLFDEEAFAIPREIVRGEDTLLVTGLLNKMNKIYCSDKVFYLYYQRDDSVTHQVTLPPEYMLEIIKIQRRIIKEEYKPLFNAVHLKSSLNACYAMMERDGGYTKGRAIFGEMRKEYADCLGKLSPAESLKYICLPVEPAVGLICRLMKLKHKWRK
ncbi:MAG: glycosyltransferase [Parabacteroides sp.]|nr:glycosyltransferase [Parabacteroides sp.]